MKVPTVAAALCLCAAPLPAAAQLGPHGERAYRFSVDAHLTRLWFDDEALPGAGTTEVGGYGGRLMYHPASSTRGPRSLLGRSSVGVFSEYTADQGSPAASSLHYGLEVDASLFAFPLFGGALDPFVSLAAGVMSTSVDLDGGSVDRDDFALTPGLGIRVPLYRALGVRGDLRLPIVFGAETTGNLMANGGGYISF